MGAGHLHLNGRVGFDQFFLLCEVSGITQRHHCHAGRADVPLCLVWCRRQQSREAQGV